MKQWLKITLWSLFGLAVVTGLYLTQKAQGEIVLSTPEVKIHADGFSFIMEEELRDSLRHEALIYEGQKRNQLDIEGVEAYLEGISQIKDVKVYSMLGSKWRIDVETRKPIAKIYNRHGQSFYLDSDGETMEISRHHPARILVVTGEIPDVLGAESVPEIINNDTLKSIRKLDDIYRISNYVCNDPLFRSLVGQVHLKSNGDFVLIPLVGDQKIIFGSAYTEKEVTEKFKKLRIFYKEAMPYEGWETYTEISLKYEDQIVCKRKKETNG